MDNQKSVGPAGTGANADVLHGIMREASQRILRSASDLTGDEEQLLYDFSRKNRVHYPLSPLRRFLEAAPKAAPADAVHIAELLRGYILGRLPIDFLGVLEAFEIEQRANCEADIAQLRYLRERHRGTRESVRDSLLGQWITTRLALDAVHRDGEAQRQIVSIAR